MKRDANFGMLTTFVGGTLWGINGVMGSFLFLYKNITTNWLIPYRLVFAGLLLLGYLYYKQSSKIFDILKNPKDLLQILLFGFIGMLGTQYTYFSAIQYSNAAIATVLTYFGPTLVLIFMCLKERRKPLKYEIIAILLSSFGVFLLATHGDVTNLQISFKALVWGLLSALSVVIYTVQPEKLLKKYGPPIVVAWGMIIGGILITFVTKPWNIDVIFDFTAFFVFLLIVFFGTIVAFILYLTGVNIIGPTKASIIACIEPVAATICAILFLGVSFGGIIMQEVAKQINYKKVVIISSVKTQYELPKKMLLARYTHLHKLLPVRAISHLEFWKRFSFSEAMNKRLTLYEKYIGLRSPSYLDWSIDRIVNWQQKEPLPRTIHIHGDKDPVFPIQIIKNATPPCPYPS